MRGAIAPSARSPAFFGLRAVLRTLALTAPLRLKTPEQLTQWAPGELGLLLGLDRAPEVKTLRRKLTELEARGLARRLHQALAERWAAAAPADLGLLCIDGHVRPYYGRTHELAKHHVPRRGRPMAGTQDFHVRDPGRRRCSWSPARRPRACWPCWTRPCCRRSVAWWGPSGGSRWSSTARVGVPEGFARWQAQGFDLLTYRKGEQSRWQERFFTEVKGSRKGHQVTSHLAERPVKLDNGLPVRAVRRLTDEGHQTAVITTWQEPSTLEVAGHMFNR